MQVTVHFYSYFKDLTGCPQTSATLSTNANISDLLNVVFERFPKLREMRKSMLIAVGVDYQKPDFVLHEGDEVSLFPPVQGG